MVTRATNEGLGSAAGGRNEGCDRKTAVTRRTSYICVFAKGGDAFTSSKEVLGLSEKGQPSVKEGRVMLL